MRYSVLLLVALVVVVAGDAITIGSNATTACASGCYWSNPALYSSGQVPGPNDVVTLQVGGVLTITADVDVTIAGLSIGWADQPDSKHTINIMSGTTFTIGTMSPPTGTADFLASSTLNVQNNANLIIGGQATSNGIVTLAGTITMGGGGGAPGFTIESHTILAIKQNVDATLQLTGGLLNTPQQLQISQTGTLAGYGNITGIIQLIGDLKPGADDNTPGDIWIDGSLVLHSTATSTFNIKSKTEFDHVYLTNSITTDGDLILSPINDFEPAVAQRFFIMNHTEMIGGFDSVRGSGFTSLFNDKWSIRPDQQNTIVVYASASSMAVSIAVMLVCLVASLF